MTNHLTKTGTPFIIRQADENDAESIIQYSKMVFASTDQVLTMPEEYNISIADEKAWINNISKSPNSKLLIALLDGRVAGFLFLSASKKQRTLMLAS